MTEVVVDTSVMVKMFTDELGSQEAADAVARHRCNAPDLLLVESAHVLAKFVRTRQLPRAAALDAVDQIEQLVTIHADVGPIRDTLELALKLHHSAYDVRFVVLAQLLVTCLGSSDHPLR